MDDQWIDRLGHLVMIAQRSTIQAALSNQIAHDAGLKGEPRGANDETKLRQSRRRWLASPRLTDLFDRDTPQPFFKGSKVPELEELALTETKLLAQSAALLGVSLAREGRHARLRTLLVVLFLDRDPHQIEFKCTIERMPTGFQ